MIHGAMDLNTANAIKIWLWRYIFKTRGYL